MAYKWKPSVSQRKAFAEKMSNPLEAAAHHAAKEAKADKRRAGSKFDYNSAGGSYVPTRAQYEFAIGRHLSGLTPEIEQAFDAVIMAYTCNEKCHHDYIHVVNELIRSNFN